MSWPPSKQDIYSYASEGNFGVQAAQCVVPFFRRKYRWRSLLLSVFLPIECIYLVVLGLTARRQRRYLFLNKMAANVIDATPGRDTIILGSVTDLPLVWRRGALWIPVSPLYVALAWSKWTTQGQFHWIARLIVEWFGGELGQRLNKDSWLLVQSDGLPLARAVIAVARRSGAGVCCVAHGIFHEQYAMPEIDGSRSDLNVVQSEVDANIIRRANPATVVLIEPELFRPPVPRTRQPGLSVLLVGESWHVIDKEFDRVHLCRLREIEELLITNKIPVLFRPHPSERHRAWRYGFRRLDFGSKIRSFERFSVFVGYASTLLHEADAVGLNAVQLVFEDRETPLIVRDGQRTIPRVRTADELLRILSQIAAGRLSRQAESNEKRAEAVVRVVRTLQGRGRDGHGIQAMPARAMLD